MSNCMRKYACIILQYIWIHSLAFLIFLGLFKYKSNGRLVWYRYLYYDLFGLIWFLVCVYMSSLSMFRLNFIEMGLTLLRVRLENLELRGYEKSKLRSRNFMAPFNAESSLNVNIEMSVSGKDSLSSQYSWNEATTAVYQAADRCLRNVIPHPMNFRTQMVMLVLINSRLMKSHTFLMDSNHDFHGFSVQQVLGDISKRCGSILHACPKECRVPSQNSANRPCCPGYRPMGVCN